MVIGHDPFGAAIIRPPNVSDACRNDVRKAVRKLLPECPAAIIIDLSEASHLPRLVQTTLLSLAIEAAQEPATPLGLCTSNVQVARELSQNGPAMRVFRDIAEARRTLMTSAPGTSWIRRSLSSGPDAPSAAATHVDDACQMWGLSAIRAAARTSAFQLVLMARGPYELHLTLSLRPRGQLLINVRNYSTAAKASRETTVRMALAPADEARILAKGAVGCGRLVGGAGIAWWAILNGHPSG